jgi:hypothetical protein
MVSQSSGRSVGLIGVAIVLVFGALPLLQALYHDLNPDSFPDSIDSVDQKRETKKNGRNYCGFENLTRNFTTDYDWTDPGVNKAQCLISVSSSTLREQVNERF